MFTRIAFIMRAGVCMDRFMDTNECTNKWMGKWTRLIDLLCLQKEGFSREDSTQAGWLLVPDGPGPVHLLLPAQELSLAAATQPVVPGQVCQRAALLHQLFRLGIRVGLSTCRHLTFGERLVRMVVVCRWVWGCGGIILTGRCWWLV